MQDQSALNRAGISGFKATDLSPDHRIRVDQLHLRKLEALARNLSLLPRQPSNSILNGRRASRLRGRGLNFEELREYLPGDDSRSIDWKVTARTGKPHVRVYSEERDRPTLIIVDQRVSMFFGSVLNMKSVAAAEAAAITAFMVNQQRDRVGGIIFNDDKMQEFRPVNSRGTLNAFISSLAKMNQQLRADLRPKTSMSINEPLEMAVKIAKTKHLVVVLSDFDGVDETSEMLVGELSRRNDVILCRVFDPTGQSMPKGLNMAVTDGELQFDMDTRIEHQRTLLNDYMKERFAHILRWEKKFGVPVLPLNAGLTTLSQFQKLLGH